MIILIFFAFLTGLHLALLQFNYLFILQINISSTYLTYILIVISWMAGTIGGLWWKHLRPGFCLLSGVGGYYMVYAMTAINPLSRWTFVISVAGVMLSGLWAGRFFTAMAPLFGGADKLFFHENNGFLAGIILVFTGFTLLGQPFLLYLPALSASLLLLLLRRYPSCS